MIKSKIYEIAKDIGKTSKEIINLLEKYFPSENVRKHNSSIYEQELNFILEHLSSTNQIKNIQDYLVNNNKTLLNNVYDKKNNDIKDVKTVNNVKSKEQPQNNNNNNLKTFSKSNFNNQKNFKQNNNTQNNKPNGLNKFNNTFKEKTFKNTNVKNNINQEKSKLPYDRTVKINFDVNKTKNESSEKILNTNSAAKKFDETKTVHIRTSDINLDKYNEKYEQIAPQNVTKTDFSNKQKITQKSVQRARQQYNKRETEAEKLRRLEEQRKKNKPSKIILPEELVVGELASKLRLPATQIIKKLMLLGIMANVTQIIDYNTASLIAEEFDVKCEKEVIVTIEERLFDETEDKKEDLVTKSPVVVVMGHVDHGKTSLLDAIRDTNIISTEAGGITQHIGAYRVKINNKYITFLDTPGHEAFTSMRARGAQITDIAILVVAADDGIMPQTIEAINHAKAAGISIIVAINKIDKPGANIDKVKQELMEHNLIPEEWGGDVICVPVSAKQHKNIDNLLEMVTLVAEVKDLRSNPNRLAKGTVIEARLDKGRGPVASILVQNGTLKKGDIVIAGTTIGKVRVMKDDCGNKIESAGPSVPVEITGLSEVPSAGDIFNAVEDEKLAKELVNKRKHDIKQEKFNAYQKVTLDNLFSRISQGEIKELPIIVKADVNGSVEAVKQSLEKLSNDEVRVKVIHGGVGAINKSDVTLASASNAIVIGFNVRPDPIAKEIAELNETDIRLYRIIYDAIDEIKFAMKGMLAPKTRETDLGRAEVRKIYRISNIGIVAGCYVLEGKIIRNAKMRIVRDGIIIADDEIKSLKRLKDDAKEVLTGFECGVTLEKFNDVKEGDILESYIIEEYRD